MRRALALLFLVSGALSLSAERVLVTSPDSGAFVCKDSADVEGFIDVIAKLSEEFSIGFLNEITTQHRCIFLRAGDQVNIPDKRESFQVYLESYGQELSVTAVEVVSDLPRICHVDAEGNASTIDFAGKAWTISELLDEASVPINQ